MQDQRDPPDLLAAFAHEREAVARRRRTVGWSMGGVLVLAGVVEPFVSGTLWLIGGTCIGLLSLVLLGVALGYSASVFLATWTYAHSVQDRGQTRPTARQVVGIFALCAAGALPIAAFAIHEEIDARFWGALMVLAWNNLSCALLGYASAFYTRLRPRTNPPPAPIED